MDSILGKSFNLVLIHNHSFPLPGTIVNLTYPFIYANIPGTGASPRNYTKRS